jgi:hypothetical protein
MRQARAVTWVLLGLLVVIGRAVVPTAPPTLAVRIIPTRFDEDNRPVIELAQHSPHFDVVVTNVSDKPVRLWREWCSWGYFSLSFLVTGEDGKPVVVRKDHLRAWTKNFADASTVAPGGQMGFEVKFDDRVWQDFPLPAKGQSRSVLLKAVYAVTSDHWSEKCGVWTGQVSSPERQFRFISRFQRPPYVPRPRTPGASAAL